MWFRLALALACLLGHACRAAAPAPDAVAEAGAGSTAPSAGGGLAGPGDPGTGSGMPAAGGGSAAKPPLDGGTRSMLDAGASLDAAVVDAAAPSSAWREAPVPPPEPQGCITDASAGQHSLTCDGLGFELSVPERCLELRCGLVIDVHGGTMSAAMEEKNTKMRELGREHGYVVIQPNANIGLFDYTVDDASVYGFANLVIDVFHLDPDHVHMMGFSQGGYMTWRFVCAHTDWLASAAPAAAAGTAAISVEVGCTFTDTDVPSGELDVFYMHGHVDGLVDFANAGVLRDAILGVWTPASTEVIDGDAEFTRTRYTTASGRVFEFLEHDYRTDSAVGVPPLGLGIVGHCYPGSDDLTITEPGQLMAFGCTPPNAFTWGKEAMRFFEAHPRRRN